jgi:hypothetical protein
LYFRNNPWRGGYWWKLMIALMAEEKDYSKANKGRIKC